MDQGMDPLDYEWKAIRGQLTGTVYYSPESRHAALETFLPLPFARIEVGYWQGQTAPHRSLELQADSAGRYRIDLAKMRDLRSSGAHLGEGSVRLLVTEPHSSFPGHWEALEDLIAFPDESPDAAKVIDLYISRPRTRVIRGRVVDLLGIPMPGALVESDEGIGSDERCDWLGCFTLDSLRSTDFTEQNEHDPLRLRLSDERGLTADVLIPWEQIPDDNDLGDLVLDPALLLTGTALGSDGAALPNWTVLIRTRNENGRISTFARCDAQGRFAFSTLHGSTHRLYLHGFAEVPIVEAAAPRRALKVHASSPTALLRVHAPNGQPIQADSWGIRLCEPDERGGWQSVRPTRGVIEDPWLETTQLTFPEPGIYQIQTEWPGLRGTWSVEQLLDVGPGHQEFECMASYEPH